MAIKIHRKLNGGMSQNLADDLYGHIIFNRSRRKSVTDGVKMMERRFRVFEDSPVHFAEVVRFDQTAELVGENITVVAVSFPQPLLFKELTCSVNEELLQH